MHTCTFTRRRRRRRRRSTTTRPPRRRHHPQAARRSRRGRSLLRGHRAPGPTIASTWRGINFDSPRKCRLGFLICTVP